MREPKTEVTSEELASIRTLLNIMRADDSSKGKRLIEKLHEYETDMYDQRGQVVGADHLEPFPDVHEDEDNNIAGYVQQKRATPMPSNSMVNQSYSKNGLHYFSATDMSLSTYDADLVRDTQWIKHRQSLDHNNPSRSVAAVAQRKVHRDLPHLPGMEQVDTLRRTDTYHTKVQKKPVRARKGGNEKTLLKTSQPLRRIEFA